MQNADEGAERLNHEGLAAAVRTAMRTMSADDVAAKTGGEISNTWVRSVRAGEPTKRLQKKLAALSVALDKPEDWAYSILHGEPVAHQETGDHEARIVRLEVLVGLRPADPRETPEETARRAAALGLFAARVAAMAQPSPGGRGGSSRRGADPQAARTPRRRVE